MKFPFIGASDDDIGTADAYAFVGNIFNVNWSATEAVRRVPVSEDVTVSDFTVILETEVGAGKTRTFTLRKNGADTAATVTLSGTGDGGRTGTWEGSVSFAAEDTITLEASSTGTPGASGRAYWYGHMNTTGTVALLMGCNPTAPATSTALQHCNAFGQAGWGTGTTNSRAIVPMDATLTKLSVVSDAAPAAGKSRTVAMRVNSTDVLTATIADSAVAATATGSQVLAAGDTIQVKTVAAGTPAAMVIGWCFSYTPGANGESFFGYGSGAAPSTTATTFEQPLGAGAVSWSASATGRRLRLPPCVVKALTVLLSVAPGIGTSRTIALGYDVTTTHTVTISDLATTGSDATAASIPENTTNAGGFIASSAVSVLPPAATVVHFGYVIVTPQPIMPPSIAATSAVGTPTVRSVVTLSPPSVTSGSSVRRPIYVFDD